MKKKFLVVFGLLLILAGFAGCSKKQNASAGTAVNGKTPVTITAVYAVGNTLTADLIHARLEGFMKANPHVTIIEKLSNEGSYLDAIRTLDAVGELPDLIEMRDTPVFVRAGKLGELPADIVNLFFKILQKFLFFLLTIPSYCVILLIQ
jgi:raffinose/stachyose/melibiose transport system substrate-binding protein